MPHHATLDHQAQVTVVAGPASFGAAGWAASALLAKIGHACPVRPVAHVLLMFHRRSEASWPGHAAATASRHLLVGVPGLKLDCWSIFVSGAVAGAVRPLPPGIAPPPPTGRGRRGLRCLGSGTDMSLLSGQVSVLQQPRPHLIWSSWVFY